MWPVQNYGTFAWSILRNTDLTEKVNNFEMTHHQLYLRALELGPVGIDFVIHWANFQWDIKKDFVKAEEIYLKNENVQPQENNRLMLWYAYFLSAQVKNVEKARIVYEKGKFQILH